MKNRCDSPGCGRPFGLIRWGWHFEQFCSVKCRESCRRQSERNKATGNGSTNTLTRRLTMEGR
jgi:hypothetical protein